MVYIGAKEDGPLAVDANKGSADLDVACKRARVFVRILSETDYLVSGILRFENLHTRLKVYRTSPVKDIPAHSTKYKMNLGVIKSR